MKKKFSEPRTPPPEIPADENNSDEPLEIIFAEELGHDSAEQDAVTTQTSSVPSAEPAPQGGAQPT